MWDCLPAISAFSVIRKWEDNATQVVSNPTAWELTADKANSLVWSKTHTAGLRLSVHTTVNCSLMWQHTSCFSWKPFGVTQMRPKFQSKREVFTEDGFYRHFTPAINRTLTLCFTFNTVLMTPGGALCGYSYITNAWEGYRIANYSVLICPYVSPKSNYPVLQKRWFGTAHAKPLWLQHDEGLTI